MDNKKFDKGTLYKGTIYMVIDHNSTLRSDLWFSKVKLVFCSEDVVANTTSDDDNIEFVGKRVCNKNTVDDDNYFHIKGTDMYISYDEDVRLALSESFFTFIKILSLEEPDLDNYIISEYKFHENKSEV